MANVNLTGASVATQLGNLLRRLAGLTSRPVLTDTYEYSALTVTHGLTQGIGLTAK